MTFLFLIFTCLYWGSGLLLISMALIMIPLSGLGGLLLGFVFRKKRELTRMLITSSFALVIGSILQALQFFTSGPDNLKTAILTPQLQDKFTATRGRVFYIGLEHEIYLKLQTTPALTGDFLRSRPYTETGLEDNYSFSHGGPEWFPSYAKPGFRVYEYNDMKTEQKWLSFVSEDSSVIYAFYLAY